MIDIRLFLPFIVGWFLVQSLALWGVFYDVTWKGRNNVPEPWEYDSEYKQAWAHFRLEWDNFHWPNVFGLPILAGGIVEFVVMGFIIVMGVWP